MPGFGVTYEGLKPRALGPVTLRSVCFGVTYEGLKLSLSSSALSNFLRFGVTYEGLKPTFAIRKIEINALFWSYL